MPTVTFIRAVLGQALLAAILLGSGCSSDSSGTRGSAGQSPGGGGQSAGHGGQSASDAGEAGDGSESAGAGGTAGGASDGNEPESNGGTAQAGRGGASSAGGSGGQATAGSSASGGESGSDECAWDPAATERCPVCDSPDGCARPGYKYVGSGAITASCCGFEWQEETAPAKYTWSGASDYCASLALLDGGWRLPKIAELYSLVDLSDESHTTPTIDVNAFADTLREVYWTSSPASKGGQNAWSVNFSDGSSQSTATNEQHRVRCVR